MAHGLLGVDSGGTGLDPLGALPAELGQPLRGTIVAQSWDPPAPGARVHGSIAKKKPRVGCANDLGEGGGGVETRPPLLERFKKSMLCYAWAATNTRFDNRARS